MPSSEGCRVTGQRLEEVLPAAQVGAPWALTAVYEELAPRVHAYLRSRGAAEPDDLTSEVFLAVFPRLPGLTGGAAGLRTLVFSVAHARLVDDYRRRARQQPTLPLERAQDVAATGSVEQDVLSALGTQRVHDLLSLLPEDQRDVLLLRLVADLTVEQVAQAIGRSAGAVKQLQRRGLVTLRARVLDEGRVPL